MGPTQVRYESENNARGAVKATQHNTTPHRNRVPFDLWLRSNLWGQQNWQTHIYCVTSYEFLTINKQTLTLGSCKTTHLQIQSLQLQLCERSVMLVRAPPLSFSAPPMRPRYAVPVIRRCNSPLFSFLLH